MANICELKTSRYGNSQNYFLGYKIEDCPDRNSAIALAKAAVLSAYPTGAFVDGSVLTALELNTAEPIPTKNDDCWKVIYGFGARKRICEPGDFSFSINIRTEVQKLPFSYEAQKISPSGIQNYPNGKLIDNGCDLQGCDVPVPIKEYKENLCFSNAAITASFCKFLASYVGSVNSQPFKGFDTCEMLLTGVTGRKAGFGDDFPWNFTFCWGISPTITRQVTFFDGSSTTITKRGWDKIWPRWECKEDETTGEAELTLSSVELHRLFPKLDHAQIFN